MTDGQWLFTVFAALYLLECARWLPGAAFAVIGSGKGWHIRRPWAQLQIAGTNLLALPVLPPMQVSLITLPWLWVPCEDGVEACEPDDMATTLLPWRDLVLRVDGGRLTLTEQVHVRLPDEAVAKAWRERLLAWASMEQAAREKDFLKFARQSLETKAFSAQAHQLSAKTRWMRSLALLIFFWTFGVMTGIYGWFSEGPEIIGALAVLLILLWTQAVTFFRAAGSERGQSRVQYRFWKALAVALLPQQAMRAADLLCRAQVCTAHPLAARELLEDQAWRKLAARFWNNLQHGRAKSAALQTRALEAFFRQQGLAVAELEEVPVRNAGSAAYCPHCYAQFVDANVMCRDCGDLALKTWPESQ